MAGHMPTAFERIGEGEGFRVGLHTSHMIERPQATMTEDRPAWPAGAGRFLWTADAVQAACRERA